MLSLRHLHIPCERKSRKKKLNINHISQVYNLDGLIKYSINENIKQQNNGFLESMESGEQFVKKKYGMDYISLRNCKFGIAIHLLLFLYYYIPIMSLVININRFMIVL